MIKRIGGENIHFNLVDRLNDAPRKNSRGEIQERKFVESFESLRMDLSRSRSSNKFRLKFFFLKVSYSLALAFLEFLNEK